MRIITSFYSPTARITVKKLLPKLLLWIFALTLSSSTLLYAGTIDNFTLTENNSDVFTFSLDSSPVVSTHTGSYFSIKNVAYDLNGVAQTPETFYFYVAALFGGVGTSEFNFGIPQLFSGSTSAPTFLTGVFPGYDYSLSMDASMTITPATSPVPEPSSMILLGTGILGAAGALKRKLRS
jgi:hypothetical protein